MDATLKESSRIRFMKNYIIIFIGIISFEATRAQDSIIWKQGELTFMSSINLYIKFDNTINIKAGEKLYLTSDTLFPAIEIKYISSTTCVGKNLTDSNFNLGRHFFALTIQSNNKPAITHQDFFTSSAQDSSHQVDSVPIKKKAKKSNGNYGRVTLSSYSSVSGNRTISRFRYTLVLNAKQIGNSKVGAESYISLQHKPGEWDFIKKHPFQYLKIYNMALKLESKQNDLITFGRKINLNISNIGAIDGLQYDKKKGNLMYGAVLGSRPNDADYGINTQLMQMGAYIGHVMHTKTGGEANNTLAFFEQHNKSKIDRRFIYLQHSNSLLKNLFAFTSAEVDLYKIKNEVAVNTISPTSIYLSLRYRPFKRLSLDASYDALKNVIYYESFKNYIDLLIEKEMRQGLRGGFMFEPVKWMTLGGSTGFRYQSSGKDASKNADVYLSAYNIPLLRMGATINLTYLQSSFVTGTIGGIRLYKSFFKDKISMDANIRKVNYSYPTQEGNLKQNIISTSMNAQIIKKISLSINYEGTFQSNQKYSSFYTNLIKRF